MVLGKRIQLARHRKNLTQKALAAEVGVATGTIQQYELGKRRPSIEILKHIASILEVSVDDLINVPEIEDEYELICETLKSAGYNIEPSGFNSEGGSDNDAYYIYFPDIAECKDEWKEIKYSRLAEIVHKVLEDAETRREEYIKKRLFLELF